jgi:hypothetical protein
MKTLHLTLEYRWYDMIERGEKTEEYREMKWVRRVCTLGKSACAQLCPKPSWPQCYESMPTDYTHVCLHRGYTKTAMTWRIDRVAIGKGKPEWGAPDKEAVIIKLKEREDGSSRERMI